MSEEFEQRDPMMEEAMRSAINQTPSGEPRLAQLDEVTYNDLIAACYVTEPLYAEETYEENGRVITRKTPVLDEGKNPIMVKRLQYPDIKILVTSISHLEGTSN